MRKSFFSILFENIVANHLSTNRVPDQHVPPEFQASGNLGVALQPSLCLAWSEAPMIVFHTADHITTTKVLRILLVCRLAN